MTTSSDHPLPQLDYAQRPRRAWLARHRRAIISLALLLAIAGPIWWNWPSLKRRVLWLYWFHRAAAHVMPASGRVSPFGNEATQAAMTNPDYLLDTSQQPTWPTSAKYTPAAYRELAKYDGRVKLKWADPSSVWNLPDLTRMPPISFMGTLYRPDGAPRLVIITGSQDPDSRNMLRSIGAAVLAPPGWFDPLPSPIAAPPSRDSAHITQWTPLPVLYEIARVDPQNPSHLVTPYVVTKLRPFSSTGLQPDDIIGRGELDVFLQNDDSLHFALRGPGELYRTSIGGSSK